MNKFKLIAIIGALAAVTACDDEAYREPTDADLPPPPAMEPVAAEDAGEDVADTTADTPPADYSQLPPPPESSEETVQPESETLFY